MTKNKNLLTLISIFLLFLSHFSSSVMACGGFYHKGRSRQRACFANQKTIAGAIEMYNLDYGMDIRGITEELMLKLQSDGYLQSIPDDPGFGDNSWTNYFMTTDGIMCCLNHGFIQQPEGLDRSSSPFEQLKAYGETREHILSRASKKSANSMNAADQLKYDISVASEALWPTCFLLFMFWLPVTIWRLRHWRYGQKTKLIYLGLSIGTLSSGIRHLPEQVITLFLLTPVLLSLDLLVFAIRLFFTKSPMEEMAMEGDTDFSKLDDETLEKAKMVFSNSDNRYTKLATTMKTLLIIAIIPFVPWISSIHRNTEMIMVLFGTTGFCFLIGAVTGTVRFSNGVATASTGSDGTIPIARTILTASFFALPLIGYGKFAINSALVVWPVAAAPILTLAAFFAGRAITVSRLNRRFISILHSLPYIQSVPVKKHVSATGISAHPARLTCSTTSLTTSFIEGVKSPEIHRSLSDVTVPMSEVKLSLAEATCPVCGEGFENDEAWVCNDCNTPHHVDCWKFNSSCTTFGCNGKKASHYSL